MLCCQREGEQSPQERVLEANMHEDVDQILISEEQIQAGIDRVADTITADYRGKEFSVVSILKGSCVFASDSGSPCGKAALMSMEITSHR